MRALLYACTTAADLGRTVLDEKLPELRRITAEREWEVAQEFTDAATFSTGRRHGFDELCAATLAGKGDVIVASTLSDLFWNLGRGQDILRRLGIGTGIALVCVWDGTDTTTPDGHFRFLVALEFWERYFRGRARTRQMEGIVAASAKQVGASMAGRPRVVLSPMELKDLWETRGLSQPEILLKLAGMGARVSKGVLARAVVDGVQAGSLDPVKRAAAIEKRGGQRKGGPKASGAGVELSDWGPRWEAGVPVREIARQLTTEGKPTTRHRLEWLIKAALAAGQLDAGKRSENRARSAEERSRRRRAA